jgi:hypothetical protein
MITHDTKTLVDITTKKPLEIGQQVQDSRGEVHTIKGGRSPHKPSSTGRVWTDKGEFFPGVVNATWI